MMLLMLQKPYCFSLGNERWVKEGKEECGGGGGGGGSGSTVTTVRGWWYGDGMGWDGVIQ